MNQAIVKDLQKLFEEEEEDDDLLLLYLLSTRDRTDPIYETRSDQGLYKILIQEHLNYNDDKFREYSRFNKRQFNFILSLVYEELTPKTTRHCIGPEEKLFLTLR